MKRNNLKTLTRAAGLAAAAAVVLAAPLQALAGAGWQAQPSGTEEHLHGVFAFNGCDVWAVGEESGDTTGQAVVLATTNGGASWTQQTLPVGSANGTTLNRVKFTDPRHGYVVGENNAASNSVGNAGKPNFLVTSDGGTTWVDMSSHLPASVDGTGVSDIEGLAATGNEVWVAVGMFSAGENNGSGVGLLLHSSNRGNTWTTQVTDNGASMDSVAMYDSHHGWATSNDGKFWRTTDGTHWKVVDVTSSGEQVFAVSATQAVIAEDGGNVEYTTDGNFLRPASVPSPANTATLTDLAISEDGHGYATGELNGYVLKTLDFGKTWTLENTGLPGSLNYNGISMAHGTDFAWIVGENGSIGANTAASTACH